MADQDFKINIRTIADTTGIQLTRQQLTALQAAAIQGNQKAIASMNQLKAAVKDAAGASGVGFTGSAVGVGTMLSVLGATIRRVQEFNAEQDRMIEKMIKAQEESRLLGLNVADMMDAMKSAERIKTDPIEVSFQRLTHDAEVLKAQMEVAFGSGAYEDVKRYAAALGVVKSQLEGVKSDIDKKYPGGFTPTPAGPKAGKGESQALVDEIERNRKAAEESLKEDVWEFDPETGGMRRTGQKRFPVFEPPPSPALTNPPPNEAMNSEPINNATLERIAAGVETLLTLWR